MRPYEAPQRGIVSDVDAEAIGRAVLVLGEGRTQAEDEIDPSVGISHLVQIRESVEQGTPLFTIHSNHTNRRTQALELLKNAVTLSQHSPLDPSPITQHILPS